jgi:hypothetical protein
LVDIFAATPSQFLHEFHFKGIIWIQPPAEMRQSLIALRPTRRRVETGTKGLVTFATTLFGGPKDLESAFVVGRYPEANVGGLGAVGPIVPRLVCGN